MRFEYLQRFARLRNLCEPCVSLYGMCSVHMYVSRAMDTRSQLNERPCILIWRMLSTKTTTVPLGTVDLLG